MLFEFDALREPEATQFPLIGEFVRKHIRMVEIPKPQVVYRDSAPYNGVRYMPDFLISNDTKQFAYSKHAPKTFLHPSKKHEWGNDVDYETVSYLNHPGGMHDAFETWCQKVCGFGLNRIVAKYHRALWLPLYHSESLGTIWPTKFHYPAAGYAGALAEVLGVESGKAKVAAVTTISIGLCFVLGRTTRKDSVLFVLDRSTPIYRITNQSICSGNGGDEVHQFVVEFREQPANIEKDLSQYGITVEQLALSSGRIVPPTRDNVEAGYDFGNHMNAQLWKIINPVEETVFDKITKEALQMLEANWPKGA